MLILRLFIPIFLLGFISGMLYMSYSQKVMLDKGQLYNIYFIYDTKGMVIDYDWTHGINAKILQEKV